MMIGTIFLMDGDAIPLQVMYGKIDGHVIVALGTGNVVAVAAR